MTLKEKLDYHYKAFDKSRLSPDPLEFLHLFTDEKDIEAMGFIASVFAYGNVTQIIKVLSSIIVCSKNKPYSFLLNFNKRKLERLPVLKHRFYTENDVITFFLLLQRIYSEYHSVKNLFLQGYNLEEKNLKGAVSEFSRNCLSIIKEMGEKRSNGLKFMFPLPELGSACKRMNLFLRWMVRKDDLDFGLWSEIPKNKLLIPVDTHVARISKSLRLTKRKNVSWKMAEEITENLKKFDPDDPVKYDFAICHIGMRKLKF
jgi:uncharacterized protein (TIGR02757 family)